jgi:hypothetical protein
LFIITDNMAPTTAANRLKLKSAIIMSRLSARTAMITTVAMGPT